MKGKLTTVTITKVALSSAIICVLGPLSFSIPVSPVPISLGILGIFFAVYVNGWLWGTVSCLLYLLIGFVGVPVFAGFGAGAGKLFGPIYDRIYFAFAYRRIFYFKIREKNSAPHFGYGARNPFVLRTRNRMACDFDENELYGSTNGGGASFYPGGCRKNGGSRGRRNSRQKRREKTEFQIRRGIEESQLQRAVFGPFFFCAKTAFSCKETLPL